ncbi:type II secretion system minor pseudopilin GspK [Henriciella litoralis]|uniref:type II secretion system minor pseudopilin GspK n=1 Tax=Henriciella litoralis TaxID=568102 RepID=UPI0009FFB74A|nr:type II secretion system minor pseudopilin GspK [Henriciella litoralis]
MSAFREQEKGVALVTTLMIVAAMSVVAVTLSSAVLSSTVRAKALDASTQSDWLALSSEEFGRVVIGDMVRATEGRFFADMPGLKEPVPITIEGGLITITGRDAGNCFNVNLLRGTSSSAAPGVTAAQGPREDFEALVELAEVDGASPQAFASALADWMDADLSPGISGAEDSFYASQRLPYRTSGQPMVDVSEVRAVRYFDEVAFDALEPLICALPSKATVPLNINTLTAREAPLLSLAFSGALTVEGARDLIFKRPAGGWPTVEAFMTEPSIVEIAPELRKTEMLSVESKYIAMSAAIDFAGTRRLVEIVYALDGAEPAKTVWRERKG